MQNNLPGTNDIPAGLESFQQSGSFTPHQEVNVSDFFYLVVCHKKLVISIVIFSLLLSTLYCFIAEPLYTSDAVLQVDVRKNKVVNIESVVSSISSDDSAIRSELDVLTSRTLAEMVIKRLYLQNDPEFNPALGEKSVLSALMKEVKENFFWLKKPPKVEGDPELNAVIDKFLRRLEVERKERSYTIVVSFTSASPKKAKEIANALVNAYIENQLTLKYDATKRANEWLSERIIELKQKVQESEKKVQEFKTRHGLVESQGKTVTEQQISELNSKLIQARADRAQSEAKLENLENDPNTVQDVINSPTIQSLRSQEIQILRKQSELSNRYGPKHPKMINVVTELADLREKIEAEVKRITQSLKNEVYVARSKEEAIQKSLESVQGKAELSEKAQVELSELTRQMEADRAIYESFLTRYKETSEQGLEQADVKVVSYADAPLEPSYPQKVIIIFISFLGSLFFGVVIALVIESLDHTFRGAPQIEEILGINVLGMVPTVELVEEDGSLSGVVPSTILFEALRTILNSIYFQRPNNIPKSVMVTSSVPEEGKTFFVRSFAKVLAMSGMRVLVIDADLKRAALSAHLFRNKIIRKKGVPTLASFITGKADLKDIVINIDEGLDVIVSNPNTSFSQNLLESERMSYLIKVLSLQYDFIIVDCPPVMAVSDGMVISKLVDASIYVVRWGKTNRKMVQNGLTFFQRSGSYLSGVVLSQVDLEKHKYYRYGDSAYYYSTYKEYYADESA